MSACMKGIIVPMVTPFDASGKLDLPAACRLADLLIDEGVHGLFLLGTNGEFSMMSDEEKLLLVETLCHHVHHRVPIYANSGKNATQETIELSLKMQQCGVDALSIITPYYTVLTQQELYVHYAAIAEAVDVPIILYNIPKFTNNPLAADTVGRLAQIPNIIAVKDSSGSLENMGAYLEKTKDKRFAVLDGSDGLILSALQLGVSGAVAGTANLIAPHVLALYHSFVKGEDERAKEEQQKIDALRMAIKPGTAPSLIKRAMVLSGREVGEARLPILTPDMDERLCGVLATLGIAAHHE